MRRTQKLFGGIILVLVALTLGLIPRASSQSSGAAQTGNAEPVPAFHKAVPEGPLPETLAPALFDNVTVRNAYSVAANVKKILYQQPCYCHCDVHEGHGSLLDCFVSNHTAGCGVCMKEVFYTYEQKHNGKTVAQIREGIEQGEWKKVDLKKYETPLSVD
jgi:Protein of unknown function with PCYCGC motif